MHEFCVSLLWVNVLSLDYNFYNKSLFYSIAWMSTSPTEDFCRIVWEQQCSPEFERGAWRPAEGRRRGRNQGEIYTWNPEIFENCFLHWELETKYSSWSWLFSKRKSIATSSQVLLLVIMYLNEGIKIFHPAFVFPIHVGSTASMWSWHYLLFCFAFYTIVLESCLEKGKTEVHFWLPGY